MKVTKWSTSIGDLTVNEQKPEETSGEPTSLGAVPAVSPSLDAQSEPVAASAQKAGEEAVQAPSQGPANAESPSLAPEEQAAAAEMPKADAPKTDSADAPIAAAEADAPPLPGKVVVMSSDDRSWADHGKGSGQ